MIIYVYVCLCAYVFECLCLYVHLFMFYETLNQAKVCRDRICYSYCLHKVLRSTSVVYGIKSLLTLYDLEEKDTRPSQITVFVIRDLRILIDT